MASGSALCDSRALACRSCVCGNGADVVRDPRQRLPQDGQGRATALLRQGNRPSRGLGRQLEGDPDTDVPQ